MVRTTFLDVWSTRLLSVLRIIAGFMFLFHGARKLFNFPPTQDFGGWDPFSLAGVGGVIEFFGGTLILFGLFTRPVAFILSGTMAVAYFTAHASGGFLPIVNRGELAVLYCFVWLYLAVAGGGQWSLDRLIFRRQDFNR